MLLETYSSDKCPRKPKDFASKLEMRISPLNLNYMQEQVLRLQTYFFEQFIDCFMLADPYQDPKSAFEELQQRQNIGLD